VKRTYHIMTCAARESASNYQDQLKAESERSIGGAITGEGESRDQTLGPAAP
jgi:hypothetical protein